MMDHPSSDIKGTKGSILHGKLITHCITSSVALIKAPEVTRELLRSGAEVQVVMSRESRNLINPNLMEWASGNPVVTKLTGKLEHVSLGENSGLILVCPATANVISKIACGIDDDPVTAVVSCGFGSRTPIVLVPAMHESMYEHPILVENITKLEKLGVDIVVPRVEEGKAKIADTERILFAIMTKIGEKAGTMRGLNLMVTAGPTEEKIDPVRSITNASTGKMGIALAEEAALRGADVTLVYGPGLIQPPSYLDANQVRSGREMYDAVRKELKRKFYDVFISAAAISDFLPDPAKKEKIQSKDGAPLNLKLRVSPKLIDQVKQVSSKTFLVAFKAEYRKTDKALVSSSRALMKSSRADLVIANDIGRKGSEFGSETIKAIMIGRKVTPLKLGTKRRIAARIMDEISLKTRKR
ncbi:MAG: bifunctional phosphopantothenoylcysteine decarboxylase/phosphopantothenate--cysteine ligase CoaBC [Nitrososphaerales archaeon]